MTSQSAPKKIFFLNLFHKAAKLFVFFTTRPTGRRCKKQFYANFLTFQTSLRVGRNYKSERAEKEKKNKRKLRLSHQKQKNKILLRNCKHR